VIPSACVHIVANVRMQELEAPEMAQR
jgi:hypothetical protein